MDDTDEYENEERHSRSPPPCYEVKRIPTESWTPAQKKAAENKKNQLDQVFTHLNGRRLFSREKIQEAQTQVQEFNAGRPGYYIDIDGHKHPERSWKDENGNTVYPTPLKVDGKCTLLYKTYEDVAEGIEYHLTNKNGAISAFDKMSLEEGIYPRVTEEMIPGSEKRAREYAEQRDAAFKEMACYGVNYGGREQIWIELFDKGAKLREMVKDWKSTHKPKKMVCFGLGELIMHGWKSYCQHKAAMTLAQELGIESVYFQDPRYTYICKDWILSTARETFQFPESATMIIDNPDGILIIDNDTFVVDLFAAFPVQQILADIAHENGIYPMGMLWEEIPGDEDIEEPLWAETGRLFSHHNGLPTRYVAEMVRGRYEEKPVGLPLLMGPIKPAMYLRND